jgi:glutaminyl-peptide cyclotransferase
MIDQVAHDSFAFTERLTAAETQLGEHRLGGRQFAAGNRPGHQFGALVHRGVRVLGKGIAVVGDAIWQRTWKDGVALEWDRATLGLVKRIPLDGAGEEWGLCADGARLVSSDGSDVLAGSIGRGDGVQ